MAGTSTLRDALKTASYPDFITDDIYPVGNEPDIDLEAHASGVKTLFIGTSCLRSLEHALSVTDVRAGAPTLVILDISRMVQGFWKWLKDAFEHSDGLEATEYKLTARPLPPAADMLSRDGWMEDTLSMLRQLKLKHQFSRLKATVVGTMTALASVLDKALLDNIHRGAKAEGYERVISYTSNILGCMSRCSTSQLAFMEAQMVLKPALSIMTNYVRIDETSGYPNEALVMHGVDYKTAIAFSNPGPENALATYLRREEASASGESADTAHSL